MSDSYRKQKIGIHILFTYLIGIVTVSILIYFHWLIGFVMALILAASIIISLNREKIIYRETEQYIKALSHRVKRVGEEALLDMPYGIILYDEDFKVEWSNPYMNQFAESDTLVGTSLYSLSEELVPMIKESKKEIWLTIDQVVFHVMANKEDRLLYLFDRTELSELKILYENEQTVLMMIYLDNFEEISQNMDDTFRSSLNSNVTTVLNEWSRQNGIYIKRTSQDRFLGVGTKEILQNLEDAKFSILDSLRELEVELEQKNPVTISIGVGVGNISLPKLGQLAQSSLDLALGRGGDQVVIKTESGKVRFYGGKTNPMEKRTRVRARVISHALTELIRDSDNVIIMGHKSPDMDSIGSAIGILNIVNLNDIPGYIVFDNDDFNPGIYRMIEAIQEEDTLWRHFIESEEAENLVNDNSLIVVVDTHKPALVSNERILYKSDRKVVIDHHRRGEDFIEKPTLVYMEPYASSTAELVTELLEYQQKNVKLSIVEASALLSGIIVDTKGFTLRTGSRTFDAASYLRSKGADTVLVQRFMKEDLNTFLRRNRLIERVEIYRDIVAISTAEKGEIYDPVTIAQAADTLLTMTGITASFVISERRDGRIGVSARSLGDINVQLIMEKMDGGGHLTNAATQIAETTIEETKEQLKNILEAYFEGRE